MDLEEEYNRIYRYCYFKTRHRETAEDITQETFLRFLEHEEYQNSGHALQYLYTIAGHLCIDEFRRPKSTSLESEPAAAPEGELSPQRLFVRMALAALDEEDRELLLLRHVNEVPVAVIGKLMGLSRFAVYRRLRQAERRLQQKLGKEDF